VANIDQSIGMLKENDMARKLALAALLASCGSISALAADIGRSSIEANLSTDETVDAGQVSFASLPSEGDIARLFKAASQPTYRAKWDCGVSRSGQLENCNLADVSPKNADRRALKALLDKVRLDAPTVKMARQKQARVYLDAYFDDGRPGRDRSCPPGWCPVTPAPPPPPEDPGRR